MRWTEAILSTLLSASCLAACDERPSPVSDAAAAPTDAGLPTDAGVDSGTPPDAGPDAAPPPDAGPTMACTPSVGADMVDAMCQQVAINVLQHGAATPTAEVHAMLSGVGSRCVEVESVVLLDGDTEVQRLDGVGTRRASSDTTSISATTATVDPRLRARCDSEADRFDRYRVRIEGRIDGGRFEAECGRPESGTSWPPDSVVLCHEGLEHGPIYAGSASVEQFMMTSARSEVFARYPHPGGAEAIATVGGSVHIFASADPFAAAPPPAARSSDGWTALIHVSTFSPQATLDVTLHAGEDAFGPEMCPTPDGGGGPFAAPPVSVVRFEGTGPGGAFSSEVHVGACTRSML